MAKIKIYELAKELSVESKDIIRRLNKMGVEVKNHMSSISPKDADAIRNSFGAEQGTAAAPGGFVPRVKRIPKAVAAQEQTAEPVDSPDKVKESPEEPSAVVIEKKDTAPAVSANTAPATAPAADKHTEPALPEEKSSPSQDMGETAPLVKEAEAAEPQKKPVDVETKAAAKPGVAEEKTTVKAVEEDSRPQRPAALAKADNKDDSPEAKGAAVSKPTENNNAKSQNRYSNDRPENNNRSYQNQRPQEGRSNDRNGNDNKYRGNRNNDRTGDRNNNGYQGKRNNDRPQGDRPAGNRPQSNRPQGNRPAANNKPAAKNDDAFPVETKPSNYRPNNKKVFVKDLVFERNAEEEKMRNRNSNRKGKGRKDNRNNKKEVKVVMPPVTPKKITIGETVILGELAKTMGKSAGEIIKKLFGMGIMATINQELDADTAILLADEFGVTVEVRADKAAEIMEDIVDDEGDMKERPPVVTIMGHVDHGKTSLLDAIRHTNVVSGEAGGITQHIGAYQVEIKGKKITFLDTPGHEAFTAMRARGANMTDIAIIVVAADDGVMPQTVEAINHSKAAGVPIIIAINKIDKPGADPTRVKQELTEYGLVSEDWGGDTIMVEVSAKARLHLEELLEMILLVAEMGELKANYDRQARGVVVEAKLDKNRGPIATLLVQKGTLCAGDNILAGAAFGKVRAMHDDKGRKVRSAVPSTPVEVLGFSDVPTAGEIFVVVKDEKDARMVAAKQSMKKREEELHRAAKISLDNLFEQIAEGEIKELNLVVKADVQGSVEALIQSLVKLNTDEVKVNVIHSGVGAVSESDVMLASASNAIILGFNIIAPAAARAAAEAADVDIRLYRVIYDALEDIKLAMSGLLAPEYKERIIGHVDIRQVIHVPKVGFIAGSYVTDGKVTRNALVRVIRNNAIIADDKIQSLRRFKDDAKEVLQGFECGICLENFHDVKEGDSLEVYEMEEIARQL